MRITLWILVQAHEVKVMMKRMIYLLLAAMVLISACDGNVDAYTVTYNYGDENRSNESVQVPVGARLEEPDDPSRDGYVFKGWFTDDGAQFDFSTHVAGSMRLNAKWSPAWTVTLLFHGAAPDLTFLVEKDVGNLSLPKYPEIFITEVEWYADGSTSPFLGRVTSDLTLSPRGEDGYILTTGNTYIVHSASGFAVWRSKVEKEIPSPNCTLACDLSSISWTPIGRSQDEPYGGTFDGRGHTIRNLNITDTYASLFNNLSGTVKNLRVENLTLNSSNGYLAAVGGIAAYALGHAVIENCEVVNANIKLTVNNSSKETAAGGIVGRALDARIEGCTFEGNITASVASGHSGNVYIGGIAGIAGLEGAQAEIIASSSAGTYKSNSYEDSIHIGGLAGQLIDCRLAGCYSMADAPFGLTGEIKKNNSIQPTIDSCYFTSSILYPAPIINAEASIGKLEVSNSSVMEGARDEMNQALERAGSKYRFSDRLASSESGTVYDESNPFALEEI